MYPTVQQNSSSIIASQSLFPPFPPQTIPPQKTPPPPLPPPPSSSSSSLSLSSFRRHHHRHHHYTLDGWELQGDLFPSENDHTLSLAERYHMYCGETRPKKIFISSQNVALIQFRLPNPGEGFKVFVNFKNNPQPCNAVAMFDMGTLTMKNYGLRRNCTTSIIYPEQIHMLNVDVGVTSETKPIEAETGLKDTVINYSPEKFVLGCQHSVVRMVSSGIFHNTVTFQYSPPKEEEINATETC
ncbi:corticotropin-releasing factor-binding protein-like [Ruditapes philippinarum]|uniref:corticotropin-releasing factor-binding protein-like n=1 Tax=Ruditapes philippinarum TaxID=129788 RepID=UPI00295B6EBB|nr:corticotropin-releasing factor-binding protein-like [Ruditapes philippinarum]